MWGHRKQLKLGHFPNQRDMGESLENRMTVKTTINCASMHNGLIHAEIQYKNHHCKP